VLFRKTAPTLPLSQKQRLVLSITACFFSLFALRATFSITSFDISSSLRPWGLYWALELLEIRTREGLVRAIAFRSDRTDEPTRVIPWPTRRRYPFTPNAHLSAAIFAIPSFFSTPCRFLPQVLDYTPQGYFPEASKMT